MGIKNKKENGIAESNAKERLLETAIGLFAEKGYAGTSVRKIVARAGVSKPVLYYYFQSKEGLFHAILDWAEEVQQKILAEIAASSGSVLERLIYFQRRVYEGIQEHQSLYRMIHGLMFGPPQGAPDFNIIRYRRNMIDAVRTIYSAGIIAGEVKDSDADEVAFLVLGLLDSCLNMDLVQPDLTDPQRPERLLRLAFQGLIKGTEN